jgi:hypothetical protein
MAEAIQRYPDYAEAIHECLDYAKAIHTDLDCTVCASVRHWTLDKVYILDQHRRHYQAGNVLPGSFAELMIREAARFRAVVDRPGLPESLTQERQRYERLLTRLLPLVQELKSWSNEHEWQLIGRDTDRAIACLPPEERETIYALQRHPWKKRHRPTPQWNTEIVPLWLHHDRLKHSFPRIIRDGRGLLFTLRRVLAALPDPPTHRPADMAPLKDCVKRLRAIYKHTVGKEPGKGKGPFAKGVYHFVHAVTPEYNTSTDAIAVFIKRTLT